jgi:hypothetical protein
MPPTERSSGNSLEQSPDRGGAYRDDRHAALRRDLSRVGDLVVLHGPHLFGSQRCHGNRFPVERHELDFVSLTLVMHQHDRPDVAGCEAVVREIARQHDFVEFIDHVRVTSGH